MAKNLHDAPREGEGGWENEGGAGLDYSEAELADLIELIDHFDRYMEQRRMKLGEYKE